MKNVISVKNYHINIKIYSTMRIMLIKIKYTYKFIKNDNY